VGDSQAAHLARPGTSSNLTTLMNVRTHLLLFLSGLILPLMIARYQPVPGYLDSDYYFAGGIQLASGRGFTEPYLWNYLDDPQSLPHPSHGYWMPLASIVAAFGMWLTGRTDYMSGRLGFIIIAGCIPPITAALAYRFSRRRDLAITSALLAIFSIYHTPFLGVTDNFGLFMLFGGLYFLVVTRLLERGWPTFGWLLLGLLAGLMSLARSDGLLWLALTGIFALWRARQEKLGFRFVFRFSMLALLGFLAVMSPWYARNIGLFGSPLGPGGNRTLWLDNYDQTFTYPASQLTARSFFSLGWEEILKDRLWSLGQNLQSGFAAHGGIILFPFIIAGLLNNRTDDRVRLGVLAWLILLGVMTVVFPFAGARGAFFHSGAALQPLWWSMAPLGLESVLGFLRKRGWGTERTPAVFRSAMVMIAVMLTAYVVWLRLFNLGWGEGELGYPRVEQYLVGKGMDPGDIVIVRNSPGYYLATGRTAIVIPYGDEQTILAVAEQFGAHYLILESKAALLQIRDLYERPERQAGFIYLGEIDGTRLYEIKTD
jgi:hypothetical protein